MFQLYYYYDQNVNGEGATTNENAACGGDLLTVDDEESDPSQEKNEDTAPTQAADLMVSVFFSNYYEVSTLFYH